MLDGLGLLHGTEHRAGADFCARLQLAVRREVPDAAAVEGGYVQAAADVVSGFEGDLLQRALHAVEDPAEQSGAQLHRQGPTQAHGGLARAHAVGGLVGLDDRLASAQGDDFAEQPQLPDLHLLAVARARQIDGDDRAVDVADDPDPCALAHVLIR